MYIKAPMVYFTNWWGVCLLVQIELMMSELTFFRRLHKSTTSPRLGATEPKAVEGTPAEFKNQYKFRFLEYLYCIPNKLRPLYQMAGFVRRKGI